MNPLDWPLYINIPVFTLAYLGIMLGDLLIWRWWAHTVPATHWDQDKKAFMRTEKETYIYENRLIGSYWSTAWPLKYFGLFFFVLFLAGKRGFNWMFYSIEESATRTRNAKLLEERQKRYDELWEEISTWTTTQGSLSWDKRRKYDEFLALEEFVPARPLPVKEEKPRFEKQDTLY